jgi:hypothetical protein
LQFITIDEIRWFINVRSNYAVKDQWELLVLGEVSIEESKSWIKNFSNVASSKRSYLTTIQRYIGKHTPFVLNIQQGLQIEEKALAETSAGMAVNEEIVKLKKRHEKNLKEIISDIHEVLLMKDEKMARHMEEIEQEMQEKLRVGDESQYQNELRVKLDLVQA